MPEDEPKWVGKIAGILRLQGLRAWSSTINFQYIAIQIIIIIIFIIFFASIIRTRSRRDRKMYIFMKIARFVVDLI